VVVFPRDEGKGWEKSIDDWEEEEKGKREKKKKMLNMPSTLSKTYEGIGVI
jgi:hypothetical protein